MIADDVLIHCGKLNIHIDTNTPKREQSYIIAAKIILTILILLWG